MFLHQSITINQPIYVTLDFVLIIMIVTCYTRKIAYAGRHLIFQMVHNAITGISDGNKYFRHLHNTFKSKPFHTSKHINL